MSKTENIGPRIGAHKSIARGIDKAIDRGIESTCECLQIFTRPPRRWAAGKMSLSNEVVEKFLQKSKKAGYNDTSIHLPYLPNLVSPETDLHKKSIILGIGLTQSLNYIYSKDFRIQFGVFAQIGIKL